MEDKQIISLFQERSETAIAEAQKKYGRYCHRISYNILHNDGEAEECVNDTFFKAWSRIPPDEPECLSAFLGKIARNFSLNRYEKNNAEKRLSDKSALVLEELGDCISDRHGEFSGDIEIREALNSFLDSMKPEARKIFVRRYWYFSTIKEIAADFGIGVSKVKMTLLRARNDLREYLEKEGIDI